MAPSPHLQPSQFGKVSDWLASDSGHDWQDKNFYPQANGSMFQLKNDVEYPTEWAIAGNDNSYWYEGHEIEGAHP